jgi:CheY-like chemotaxis protein
VLVVDDDELVLRFAQRVLAAHAQVFVASSVAGALECLEKNPHIDAVLTDYNMPGGTGDALLQWLQKTRPEVRRVLMTASDPGVAQLLAPLCNAFVEKPLTLLSLKRVLF